MKFWNKNLSASLIAVLFLSGCASAPETNIVNNANADFLPSDTVSFAASLPDSGASNVKLDSAISIKFSGPIRTQSVIDNQKVGNGISIVVTDEVGLSTPGIVSFNSAGDQIDWVPQINGRRINLNPSTHYGVRIQNVEDPQGRIIAPWFLDFHTVQTAASTGKFQIVGSVRKTQPAGNSIDFLGSSVLFQNQSVEAQFSEEIFPGAQPGTPAGNLQCSTTTWSNVFQIEDLNLGGVMGFAGTACIVCRSVPGRVLCDTLKFTPNTPWVDGSFLRVTVRPSVTLKGVSGEPLAKEGSSNFIVFPNLYSVFQ